jgi:hypothetical protein
MIKRSIITGTISIFMALVSLSAVYAAGNPVNAVCSDPNITAGNAGGSSLCTSTSTSQLQGPGSVVNLIVNIISAIAGFVAVIIIIISGIQFMNSGGDSKKISQAKDSIIYSAIGLIVIVLARFIIDFILTKVG